MTTDEELGLLIRDCVEGEVRDVVPPADLAERIVERHAARRPARPRFAAPLAALATAAAAVAVPVVLGLAPGDVQQVTAGPVDLRGRVHVGALPNGMRPRSEPTSVAQAGPAGSGAEGRSVWTRFYRSDERGGGSANVQVISGGVTLEQIVVELAVIAPRPVEMPSGRALVARGGRPNMHLVLWEPEPGLIIIVRASFVTRDQALQLAREVVIDK